MTPRTPAANQRSNRVAGSQQGGYRQVAAVLQGEVQVMVGLDTQVSSSNMTTATLAGIQRQVAVSTKLLEPPVIFDLGNGGKASAASVAYVNVTMHAKHAPITIKSIPFYILDGEAGDPLIGQPKLDVLDYQDPADWLDDISKEGERTVDANAPAGVDPGGREKAQRVQLREVRMDLPEADSEEEDQPEQGMREGDDNPNAKDVIEKSKGAWETGKIISVDLDPEHGSR